MADRLLLSVVIITRNRAESLKDTLESLARQSRPADEVIVVNNASTDNTREVALSYQDKLNIKYVLESKISIPHSRNAGVSAASGDIVVSLDDDCVADVDWLKYIEIPFIKDPHIGAVGGEVSYLKTGDDNLELFYIENMVSRSRRKK